MPKLSVVIPVYNSEEILPSLLRELELVLARAEAPFEVILVNDGSADGSWARIQQLQPAYPWLVAVNLMRNFGQHAALLCGIRTAAGEVIITMDDDLQNPPAEIPRLLARLGEGFDLVYGVPSHDRHGLWRNVTSWFVKLALQQALGVRAAQQTSTFRAFRAEITRAFAEYRSPYVSIDVLLSWGAAHVGSVLVEHEERASGSSQYSFYRLAAHAVTMMTGFSTLPLRIASVLGFAASVLGVLILVYVLGRYLFAGTVVAGFTFLAAAISIFGGAQLFAIGIIGEYLARMHFRLLDQPPYVIGAHLPARGRRENENTAHP